MNQSKRLVVASKKHTAIVVCFYVCNLAIVLCYIARIESMCSPINCSHIVVKHVVWR